MLSWQDLFATMGCKKDYFETIYTYFSLYSHPSNVSVFQFDSMYQENMKVSNVMADVNLRYCYMMLSIFISDYISYFPKVIQTFNSLEVDDQILINYFNLFARDNMKYSINESWKHLNPNRSHKQSQ